MMKLAGAGTSNLSAATMKETEANVVQHAGAGRQGYQVSAIYFCTHLSEMYYESKKPCQCVDTLNFFSCKSVEMNPVLRDFNQF